MSLSALVRALRQQALLSQEELAERSGLSVGAIRGLETGRVRKPRGASLRELAKVLARTPADRERLLAAAQGDTTPADTRAGGVIPAQLPADVAGFTGRDADLRHLDDLLGDTAADRAARAVVITAINGAAGVGKTALAVHWAHRVADRFPDGQLYVNLRGYDPEQPAPPADALARFLTALGVTGQNIPLDPEDRAARYRSELAGQRMLIVLDNAASVAQVRPLLPGTGSCMVVVTSRDSLAGLVAVHGAQRLDLDLLPAAEAVGLLRRLIGARAEDEPEAAATLAEQCVRLPLALRVAAELAASRPDSSLADLAAELADRQSRLALLDAGGDPYAAVQEVFSWSIQHLPPDATRAFRLLSLHPGPDLDPYAVAALTDTEADQARRTLELLARANLVHRGAGGRYGMHDLLRAYAAHLAVTEAADQQHDAAQRLLTYYQAAALSAMDTLHPAEAPYRPGAAVSTTPTPDLAAPDAARAWLEAERPCLIAVAAHAAALGRHGDAIRLARILYRYLDSGYPTEALTINGHAYRAAEDAGDILGQAHALRQLGNAYSRMGHYAQATDHLQQALARFREADDLVGEALTLTLLGTVAHRRGDPRHAADDHLRAIAVARHAGDRFAEAIAMSNLGIVENRLGRREPAAAHQQQAASLFQKLGARFAEAMALNNLANIELRLGRYAAANAHLRQSLAIVQNLGSPSAEAHTLDTLGVLHLRLGEPEAAAEHFEKVLSLSVGPGERSGHTFALNGLGEAAQLANRPAEALAYHTDALTMAAEAGAKHQQARAHTGLGHTHRALGDPDQARTHYEQAHALYTELDMPEAEDVRARLAAPTPPSPPAAGAAGA